MLDLQDACPLAAAWICELGRRYEIRLLLIKGQSLAHHGLRTPRLSTDVDVLADPHRFNELCAALEAAGWRQRTVTEVGSMWAGHSLTYFHDRWPCDIDVHRYFPGFLADAAATFEKLWDSRESMPIANRPAPIPSRAASLLIAGLHQLRDGQSRIDEIEYRNLAGTQISENERRDLIELAVATGAVEPARSFLHQLGVSDKELPRSQDSDALRAWRARIDADASGIYFWALLLKQTPKRRRLGVLVRALWPPPDTLRANHPSARDTSLSRITLRLSRFPNGVRGIPTAVKALRRLRSSSGFDENP